MSTVGPLDRALLIRGLQQAIEHLSRSTPAAYADLTPEESISILDRSLRALKSETSMNVAEIRRLFAPTGDLQEIAISSGWHEKYVQIANHVDRLEISPDEDQSRPVRDN